MNADDLNLYLDTVLGDTEGYLHTAVGIGPYFDDNGKYQHKVFSAKHYRWPAQRRQAVGDLLAAAEESDAYVCPYLMVADKRAQGAAVTRTKVHADIDGTLDTEKARQIGAYAIASGTPGHAQVFVALAESVPAHWHRELCRGLGAYLGDADAKIADNDLLRPAGTRNHKAWAATRAEPTGVEWLLRPDGTVWEPQALAHALGVTLPAQATTTPTTAAAEPINLDGLPQRVAEALNTRSGDRSTDQMRVVGACLDAGLTLGQTRTVVRSRQDLAERLDDRADDDVLTCWLKAIDSRQTPQLAEVDAAEFTTRTAADLPRLWNAAELAPAAQPRWLATSRIPRAAITLLVGDEGIGKSLLWVWLVAAITTGKPFPQFGIPARDPGHVIIVITEDVWASTVRPRLEVAGADLAFIRVICTDDDGSGAPIFPRDLHLIADADPAPVMVLVDAWLDTVPQSMNVKDPQQARLALHPWKETATRTDAAMLLVTHTNRVASANARDRYGITGELRKKVRMSLYAQANEDGQLVVGPEKMNTARPLPASVFTIKSVQHFAPTDDDDGTVPQLVYSGESDMTAREHLAENVAAAGSDSTDAVRWLATFLAAGPRWATDVFDAAKAAGLSEKKARTAKLRLNVEASREGSNGPWFWHLPEHTGPPDSQMTPSRASGHLGNLGESGKSHISPLSSQDSLMTNGETRGHLGTAQIAVDDLYTGNCYCGFPARWDTGLCEMCTAKARRAGGGAK